MKRGKIETSNHHHSNQHVQTKRKHPSRPIYECLRANRYFLKTGLRRRYENRCLYCLYFRDMKKMMCWPALIGRFKFRAFSNHRLFFLFIIFVNYYMSKAFEVAQWHRCWLVMLVTWVRTPGLDLLHIILCSVILCRLNIENHHIPSSSSQPRVPWNQIKGSGLRNTENPSQRVCTCHAKSQKGHA